MVSNTYCNNIGFGSQESYSLPMTHFEGNIKFPNSLLFSQKTNLGVIVGESMIYVVSLNLLLKGKSPVIHILEAQEICKYTINHSHQLLLKKTPSLFISSTFICGDNTGGDGESGESHSQVWNFKSLVWKRLMDCDFVFGILLQNGQFLFLHQHYSHSLFDPPTSDGFMYINDFIFLDKQLISFQIERLKCLESNSSSDFSQKMQFEVEEDDLQNYINEIEFFPLVYSFSFTNFFPLGISGEFKNWCFGILHMNIGLFVFLIPNNTNSAQFSSNIRLIYGLLGNKFGSSDVSNSRIKMELYGLRLITFLSNSKGDLYQLSFQIKSQHPQNHQSSTMQVDCSLQFEMNEIYLYKSSKLNSEFSPYFQSQISKIGYLKSSKHIIYLCKGMDVILIDGDHHTKVGSISLQHIDPLDFIISIHVTTQLSFIVVTNRSKLITVKNSEVTKVAILQSLQFSYGLVKLSSGNLYILGKLNILPNESTSQINTQYSILKPFTATTSRINRPNKNKLLLNYIIQNYQTLTIQKVLSKLFLQFKTTHNINMFEVLFLMNSEVLDINTVFAFLIGINSHLKKSILSNKHLEQDYPKIISTLQSLENSLEVFESKNRSLFGEDFELYCCGSLFHTITYFCRFLSAESCSLLDMVGNYMEAELYYLLICEQIKQLKLILNLNCITGTQIQDNLIRIIKFSLNLLVLKEYSNCEAYLEEVIHELNGLQSFYSSTFQRLLSKTEIQNDPNNSCPICEADVPFFGISEKDLLKLCLKSGIESFFSSLLQIQIHSSKLDNIKAALNNFSQAIQTAKNNKSSLELLGFCPNHHPIQYTNDSYTIQNYTTQYKKCQICKNIQITTTSSIEKYNTNSCFFCHAFII